MRDHPEVWEWHRSLMDFKLLAPSFFIRYAHSLRAARILAISCTGEDGKVYFTWIAVYISLNVCSQPGTLDSSLLPTSYSKCEQSLIRQLMWILCFSQMEWENESKCSCWPPAQYSHSILCNSRCMLGVWSLVVGLAVTGLILYYACVLTYLFLLHVCVQWVYSPCRSSCPLPRRRRDEEQRHQFQYRHWYLQRHTRTLSHTQNRL